MSGSHLFGPFSQLLTLDNLRQWGPIPDDQLQIIPHAGIVVEGQRIKAIGPYKTLSKDNHKLQETPPNHTALPAFIDAHTHICYGGTRAKDYALRLQGLTYQEIAARGGGILDTVRETRNASEESLINGILRRAEQLLKNGVATAEVKSGYGLSLEHELKMLRAIRSANTQSPITLVPTCLAAHTTPWEFEDPAEYLEYLVQKLLPKIKADGLSNRVDIFVEDHAFTPQQARIYLTTAEEMGFDITIHADQFSRSGAALAAEVRAISADHLEASTEEDFHALRKTNVIPILLPGATLGLGQPFPPARKVLDLGLPLCLASDWNPGSAPMGDLLTQAALTAANQKLTTAETLAAITHTAARALNLHDRGILKAGMRADFIAFPCDDYREILYHQGALKPALAVVGGQIVRQNGFRKIR